MQQVQKLTLKEFAPLFHHSKPPVGWGKKIAIAYSGGVDSTCLLHLVDKLIKEDESLRGLSLVAIHINHGLRSTAFQDVEQCKKWTSSRSIPFRSYTISWAEPPFNSLQVHARQMEEKARLARYRALYNVMREEQADTILMAHHMDDQIETALMRNRRRNEEGEDTTLIGLAGMRSCRRWGMGIYPKYSLRYYGLEGMSRWVCRPLLDIPKERLNATIREEELPFVQDETNFDPHLTERNEIRAARSKAISEPLIRRPRNPFVPAVFPQNEQDIPASQAVQEYMVLRDQVDRAVDNFLDANRWDSPEGTCHIITSRAPAPPKVLQFGIIMRVLRYVSPFPWGSPHAEAGRRSEQLDRIAKELWPYKTLEQLQEYRERGLFRTWTKFSGGGSVLWHPTPGRGIATPKDLIQGSKEGVQRTYGWLATRHAPTSQDDRWLADITGKLRDRRPFRLGWDSRWDIEFEENALDLLSRVNNLPTSIKANNDISFAVISGSQYWEPGIAMRDSSPGVSGLWKTLKSRASGMPPVMKTKFIRSIDAI